MNIYDFENSIDRTIVERGYDYYLEGHVLEAYVQGENEYFFFIEGTSDYEVMVELEENGDILYSECDCPYDFGPVCKHEVAAYFQLAEMLNTGKDKLTDGPGNSRKKENIQDVLSQLSKEALISIIKEITKSDDVLEKNLILKYSKGEPEQELEVCKELMDSVIKKYTRREGFIKYRDVNAFANELAEVAEKARMTEDGLLALDMAWLLLVEAIGAFQYADDSGGDIGALVDETLELIAELAADGIEQDSQSREMFEKLLAWTNHHVFDGWEDFKIELLNICMEFADDEKLRQKLIGKLEAMYEEQPSDSNKDYLNENILQLMFSLIEQYDTPEAADQFVQQNLQFPSFREQLLSKYIQEENYQKVIKVAKEGEEKDRQFPGLINRWKKFRYTAYQKLKMKEEQLRLGKELLLGGDFEYYQELKELASENRDLFYRNLKSELKNNGGWWGREVFLKLIEVENDLEELLQFIKDNPDYIEKYAEKLAVSFNEEVIILYEAFIYTAASNANNRKQYQAVCGKIKKYKKIAGPKKQDELINELIHLYQKRPAFVDELRKL